MLSDPRITDRFVAALRETYDARRRQKEQDEERVAARIVDPDPAVRTQGYEFLMLQGKYDPPAAVGRLVAAFRSDPDPQIRTNIAHWLVQYGEPEIAAAAKDHLRGTV